MKRKASEIVEHVYLDENVDPLAQKNHSLRRTLPHVEEILRKSRSGKIILECHASNKDIISANARDTIVSLIVEALLNDQNP